MFQIGDKVSYPMHGAGIIKCVEEEKILGEEHQYFVLEPCVGELEIKIPVARIEKVGIRIYTYPRTRQTLSSMTSKNAAATKMITGIRDTGIILKN